MNSLFEDFIGLRGGEMICMRKGISLVSVVLVVNMECNIGGRIFLKVVVIFLLEVCVWNVCILLVGVYW